MILLTRRFLLMFIVVLFLYIIQRDFDILIQTYSDVLDLVIAVNKKGKQQYLASFDHREENDKKKAKKNINEVDNNNDEKKL